MNPVFLAKIRGGKLILNNIKQFNDFLPSLEGKDVEVVVRRWQRTRSNPQNNYLWGVCYLLISEHTGYTTEEVHDAMRMLFLRDYERDIPTLRSTTGLTTVEFSNYVEQIKQWAAENLQVIIPDPEQVDMP